MDELYATCPSQIRVNGRALIIKHCYVERRMNPLNLYLQDASDDEVNEVMNDYGNAIKQLAAANIFPGDMLLKNFESPDTAGSCSTTMTRLSRWWIATLGAFRRRETKWTRCRTNLGIRWDKRYLPRGVPLVFLW